MLQRHMDHDVHIHESLLIFCVLVKKRANLLMESIEKDMRSVCAGIPGLLDIPVCIRRGVAHGGRGGPESAYPP